MGVVVKNPNFSLKKVQLLVEKKTSWIAQKLLLVEQKKLISNTYKYKNKVLLYGKEESLHVEGKLADFYKQKTQSIALPLVSKWSQKMGLMPTKVLFRKTKKRWGSCSATNELSFTSSLAQLPLKCIEYVIVHELSHIKYKHHQKTFWQHVVSFMPDFREQERVLKNYSPQI